MGFIVYVIMEDIDFIYGEDSMDIHGETFDTDFDEVGWEPEEVDDSDEEAAELFGY